MSLFSKRALGDTPNNIIPSRPQQRTGSVSVTPDTAMRSAAVWAALRLRADLVSTMPLRVFRDVAGLPVKVPTPPVLTNPGGDRVNIQEWLYSTQVDLDRVGNTFGIISETDALGKPRRIDLVDANTVTLIQDPKTMDYSYRIRNTVYSKDQIWHERQFTVSGMVMGLSPVAYAAWSLGQYQSALEFGLEWFSNGGMIPSGMLKNTARTLGAGVAEETKRRFKQAIQGRDLFVTGNDWEFSTVNVAQNESQFLDTQKLGAMDIARFFGVPGDLIDVSPLGKSAITYANVTQRNLQFLIMNLGPVFERREMSLSTLLPQPRYAKFHTDNLLRMDPDTRSAMFIAQVAGKVRTPSEVRAKDDLPPFTAEQIAEFEALGIGAAAPIPPSKGSEPAGDGELL